MFTDDRDEYRKSFFAIWRKYQDNVPLEPVEQQLLDIILRHPECHPYLEDTEKYLNAEFSAAEGETNPFLHLSLHQVLFDQISTNNPEGILDIYQKAIKKFRDTHEAEHRMMEVLTQAIFTTLKYKEAFDENNYLKKMRRMLY